MRIEADRCGRTPMMLNNETLSILLLGRPHVIVNGLDVTARIRRKSLTLLKALAECHPSAISREVLADSLWPDAGHAASFLSLKVEAHNLRRALGCSARDEDSWLRTERGVYRLSDHVWIDSHAFEKEVRDGKRAEAQDDRDRAESAYKRALELYRGDYLEEDVYEDWAMITRERLRDQQLHVLGRLATIAVVKKKYHEAIDYAHQIIETDPCREDIYQILILAHGSMGHLERSTAWYDVARQALKRELDRDVSPKTTAIFKGLFAPITVA